MINATAAIETTPQRVLAHRSPSVLEELLEDTTEPADVLVQLAPLRGIGETGTALLCCPATPQAPEHAVSVASSYDAGRLRVSPVGEALDPTDGVPATLVAISRIGGFADASVWAAGSLHFDGGQPRWLWQSGHFHPELIQVEQGVHRIRFAPYRSAGPEAAALVSVRGSYDASQLPSASVVIEPSGDLLVTSLQEGAGGGLTARRNIPLDVVVFGPPARSTSLIVHSAGGVRFDGGGQPVWAWRDGALADVALVSEGRLSVRLGAARGIGELASAVLVSPHGPQDGSQLRSIGVEHVSATELRLSLLDKAEQAEGGSRLRNFPFDMAIITATGAR